MSKTMDDGLLTTEGIRLAKVIEKFAAVLTLDQLEQVAELLVMTKDIAILRVSDQTLTIALNDKGLPRGFNASNNVRPIKAAATYKAE